MQAVLPRGAATWTIVVTNTGSVTLTNVHVIDEKAPNCIRTKRQIPALASMAPGASVTFTCVRDNVTESFTNTAIDVGTSPTGQKVSARDSARVTLLTPPQPPAIKIVKQPKNQSFKLPKKGDTVTAKFTITVINTGKVTLHDVTVTDPWAPNCNRSLGVMAKGAHKTYSCTRPGVSMGHLNIANVIGTSPTGKKVSDSDTASVRSSPRPANAILAGRRRAALRAARRYAGARDTLRCVWCPRTTPPFRSCSRSASLSSQRRPLRSCS